ncbi:hypothetical protein DFJ77DRAFT_307882 [Powellomyces hirtus]|nr:hypothetical protein DFJ77DRAFT_307882 [Powellomyces hirtus]
MSRNGRHKKPYQQDDDADDVEFYLIVVFRSINEGPNVLAVGIRVTTNRLKEVLPTLDPLDAAKMQGMMALMESATKAILVTGVLTGTILLVSLTTGTGPPMMIIDEIAGGSRLNQEALAAVRNVASAPLKPLQSIATGAQRPLQSLSALKASKQLVSQESRSCVRDPRGAISCTLLCVETTLWSPAGYNAIGIVPAVGPQRSTAYRPDSLSITLDSEMHWRRRTRV